MRPSGEGVGMPTPYEGDGNLGGLPHQSADWFAMTPFYKEHI